MVDCEFLKELARSPNPRIREHYTGAGRKDWENRRMERRAMMYYLMGMTQYAITLTSTSFMATCTSLAYNRYRKDIRMELAMNKRFTKNGKVMRESYVLNVIKL